MNKAIGGLEEVETATQMIRQAALATREVVTAAGKTIIYEDIEYTQVEDPRCYLCGGETDGQGLPVKKAIRPTFTDRSWARAPDSHSVCRGCAYCLSRMEMRNYSIVATRNELWHPSRPDMREILLSPPEPPFVFCVAQSGQKWVHFRALVNLDRERFTVAVEENRVVVEPQKVEDMLEVIEPLLSVFTKTEIETGDYKLHRVTQYGLNEWNRSEEKLRKWRGSLLFSLVIQVAQKPEEKPKEKEEKPKVNPEPALGQLSLF